MKSTGLTNLLIFVIIVAGLITEFISKTWLGFTTRLAKSMIAIEKAVIEKGTNCRYITPFRLTSHAAGK